MLWLAAGGILAALCSGTGAIPVAGWLAPVFLLHYARTTFSFTGYLTMWIVLYTAVAIANRGVLPLSGSPYFGVIAAETTVLLLPYLADHFFAPKLSGLAATLIFPLSWAGVEFLSGYIPAKGSWESVAYTQYGNVALMQVAAFTGLAGITFLIGWFAAIANWAWDRGFEPDAVRGGALLYAAVLSVVLLAGAARVARASSGGRTIRVAAVSSAGGIFKPGEVTRILQGKVREEEREPFRQKLLSVQNWLLEKARTEARAGANLVIWPEADLIIFREDESAFLERAQRLAAEEKIYLLMGLGVIHLGVRRPFENKAVLVNPSAEIQFSYRKSRGAPGWETEVYQPGDGHLPVTDTALARVAPAICFEMDFPFFIRQAGRAGADVLLVPANDWEKIKDVHFRMAVFRAVENGVSLVRATKSGVSGAVDPYGRLLAATDHFSPDARAMVAQVPVARVPTFYARFGDLFAWLCILALLSLIVFGLRQSR